MRYIYSFLFYLALPFILIRLFWKSRKNPGYRQRWWERLGYVKPLTVERAIWIHAVSLGEMVVAKPLIQIIRQNYPDRPLVITNMTSTGAGMAEQYKDDPQIFRFYIPYDFPGAIKRFLKHIRPSLLVIMETELWPNLVNYTAAQNIPIVLANARLSARSARGYHSIGRLIYPLLQHIDLIAAQTPDEVKRFVALGARSEHIIAAGNIKFDIPVPETLVCEGKALRQMWNASQRPIIIAASTHKNEEEKVLIAFSKLKQTYKNALLIIVPRHPQRFDEVAHLCEKSNFNVVRRSQKLPCNETTDIFLGDSFGELFLYYAMADIAFVGGSFVPVGGHNLLEPAVLSLPVITGPYLHNFTEIFELLDQRKAVIRVTDENELFKAFVQLLSDKTEAQAMGRRATEVVLQNRGALEKHIKGIEKFL